MILQKEKNLQPTIREWEMSEFVQKTRIIMSTLIVNLPAQDVWVRKEYLTDHKSGHGEFEKGVWIVPFILRLIYPNMLQCLINYRFRHFYHLQNT